MEKISLEQVRPEDIERRSFEIIRQKLKEMHKELGEREAPLVLRAIHTTADFDYADNLVFSPDAIECGLLALRQGASGNSPPFPYPGGGKRKGDSDHRQPVCQNGHGGRLQEGDLPLLYGVY